MRTKTVLATVLLITLGLPLAAMAENYTNWLLTLTNSDGTPAGSGSFRADADILYATPALDIDITLNGVEYDFTSSTNSYGYLYFNNYTGGVGGYALSSNKDGTQIPCIGFGVEEGGRWDSCLCNVSGGQFAGAQRLSAYGYFSVKDASEIWRDNFERPAASDTVGNGWTEIEANPHDVEVTLLDAPGPGMIVTLRNVRAGEPDAAIRRMISTAGYENIELRFAYKKANYAFTGDSLKVYYTVDDGTSWTLITSLDLESAGEWIVWSGPIGQAAANAPGFGISLESDIFDESYYSMISYAKGARVNYVAIHGTPVTAGGPPVVSDVAASDVIFPADVILTATATDTESNIVSAAYLRDGSTSGDMSAADGAFDETSEDLTATLSGLMVKTHEVCVEATDQSGNTSDGTACDTFDVTAAQLEVAFVGQLLDIDGAPTELTAEVTGPCSSGAEVEFFANFGSGYLSQGTAAANLSGVATLTAPLPVGIHEIKVEVGDQDLGGDSEPECKGDSDTGIIVVSDARASSTGGGWYKVDGLTPPRVNFGYTAQTKYNKKLDEYTTSGNLLWMHQDNYRLKGVINAGGKLPDQACPDEFSACAAFAGVGTLYQHNPAYDPECVEAYGCEPEWINAIPNNAFIFFVNDGGIVEECLNKKKCKEVELPDQFGIEIAIENVSGEADPVDLSGGNLVVR